MKMVAICAFLVTTTADFVPNAGPYLALVASLLAAYAFPAAASTSVAAILYGILGTLIYSPGFILSDLASGQYGGAQPTGNADVDALSGAVGALATGTAPDTMVPAAVSGNMAEIGYQPLSATVIGVLVTIHVICLIAGVRRRAAHQAAAERAEEPWELE